MKRIMMILFAIGMTAMSSTSIAAMSNSRVRKETRFLTDKMAYELNMNTMQYNDAYEINFDFIHSVRYLMDDVLRGNAWAIERYYHLLDVRNDDLRWILNSNQYRYFMTMDYFYRPIYVNGSSWKFRIYIRYNNHNHFYFGKPKHYNNYNGAHYRTHYNNKSYYRGRYNHNTYSGNFSIKSDRKYSSNRKSDFGSVKIRPNTNNRPSASPSVSNKDRNNDKSNNKSTVRPSSSGTKESNRNAVNNKSTNTSSSNRKSEARPSSSTNREKNSSSTTVKSSRSNSDNNRSSTSSSRSSGSSSEKRTSTGSGRSTRR
ncbi:hypothetical protein LJB80_00995 [Bacteroides sp. OttesenSCG-928-F21]|nr:hypothetical protein [Bacteroides sp. OttesenSCG-928-F21]